MAFDSLSDKLQNIFKNLRGKGRLSGKASWHFLRRMLTSKLSSSLLSRLRNVQSVRM